MPVGLGFAPVGSSIYGFGTLDSANSPLTDLYVNSQNGVSQNARRISATTRQYVFRSDGRHDGMSGVQQLVLLRIQTMRNSSVLGEFGLAKPPEVKGQDYDKQIEADIHQAMQDLYDSGQVRSDGVFVDTQSKPVKVTYHWFDLTTETEHRTEI